MNPYYIDYMIKERRQMEIEECERRRLLKRVDPGKPALFNGLMKQLTGAFGRAAAPLIVRIGYRS